MIIKYHLSNLINYGCSYFKPPKTKRILASKNFEETLAYLSENTTHPNYRDMLCYVINKEFAQSKLANQDLHFKHIQDLASLLSESNSNDKTNHNKLSKCILVLYKAGCINTPATLLNNEKCNVHIKDKLGNKLNPIISDHDILNNDYHIPQRAPKKVSADSNNILYVASSSLPHHISGYTIRTHGILTSFKDSRWNIFCATRPGYPEDRNDFNKKLNNSFYSVDDIEYRTIASGTNFKSESHKDQVLIQANYIENIASEKNVCLIHAASNYENALPSLIAARNLGLPFVYEVRGLWEYSKAARFPLSWESSDRFLLYKKLESLVAANADHVFTLTKALKATLIERGVQKDKISITPNGVDLSQYTPLDKSTKLCQSLEIDKDDFIIGYIGSLVEYEGVDTLIKSYSSLRKKYPRSKLIIVGDGYKKDALMKLSSSLNLEQHIIFTGKIPPNDVGEYYSILDVAVLARKPYKVCQLVSPLKPFEVMAMGVPIIVSDVNALKEMATHMETAIIHNADNVESLTEALTLIASNAKLRTKLAENARHMVENHHTWSKITNHMGEVYQNLINA